MSKERMLDLLAVLEHSGWQLLGEQAYPAGNVDPFSLEGDISKWGIRRYGLGKIVELEFHAFADMGQRTNSLLDIYYCIELKTELRVYFENRESALWQEGLRDFVDALSESDGVAT